MIDADVLRTDMETCLKLMAECNDARVALLDAKHHHLTLLLPVSMANIDGNLTDDMETRLNAALEAFSDASKRVAGLAPEVHIAVQGWLENYQTLLGEKRKGERDAQAN